MKKCTKTRRCVLVQAFSVLQSFVHVRSFATVRLNNYTFTAGENVLKDQKMCKSACLSISKHTLWNLQPTVLNMVQSCSDNCLIHFT